MELLVASVRAAARGQGCVLCAALIAMTALSGCNEEFFIAGLVNLTTSSGDSTFTEEQTVTLNVTVHSELDEMGVGYVAFYKEGQDPTCVDDTPPYGCEWPITRDDNGAHTWIARAYDTTGSNMGRSPGLELTVAIDGSRSNPPPGTGTGLIGWVPGVGSARDISLDTAAGLAYVASQEFGLSVVDIGDPSEPLTIASANVPFFGDKIAHSGDVAVVATQLQGGLYFIDVSDPTAPITAGHAEGAFSSVHMDGQYVYVAETIPANPPWAELRVFDASNPYAPVDLGNTVIPGFTSPVRACLDKVGSLLYVACTKSGLHIFDVSNPAAPSIRGTVDTPDRPRALQVQDGIAYISDGTSFVIADVSNPDDPTLLSSVDVSSTAFSVSENVAYVLGGDWVSLIDVTNPSAPALVATEYGYNSMAVEVQGTTAYFATVTHNNIIDTQGLVIADMSGATSSRISTTCCEETQRKGIGTDGTLAIVSGDDLEIFDVSDPTRPEIMGTLEFPQQGAAIPTTLGGAVVGDRGYVIELAGVNRNLVVLDLSDPTDPTEIGRFNLPGYMATSFRRFEVVGSRAYIPTTAGLHIIDVSNPSNLRLLKTVDTPGTPVSVSVSGSYAYVADTDYLAIVNIANPSSASVVSAFHAPTNDVVADGGYAYVVGGGWLTVFDVANPQTPAAIEALTAYDVASVSMVGDQVALIKIAQAWNNQRGQIILVDVSDPTNLEIAESISLMGTGRTAASANGLLFATDDLAKIAVVRP